MEARFGHDFSQVRVHTDEPAADSARAVNALAYTVGRDVVFDRGCYAPRTAEGQRLLAHELTHVVQQGPVDTLPARLEIGAADAPAEAEAQALTAGSGSTRPPVQIRRQIRLSPGQWDAATDITAGVLDPRDPHCGRFAQPNGQIVGQDGQPHDLFSVECRSLCVNERIPLLALFHVDGDRRPRPQPFAPPRVSAIVKFIWPTGGEQTIIDTVGEGAYTSAGAPLDTGFGKPIGYTPTAEGTLLVSLVTADSSSGEVASYSDMIRVVDCGLPAPPHKGIPVPSTVVPSGQHIYVADPIGAPQEYRLLRSRSDPGWDEPDKVYEVYFDNRGNFYYSNGEKIYLEGGLE
jgi:hypothetical protein